MFENWRPGRSKRLGIPLFHNSMFVIYFARSYVVVINPITVNSKTVILNLLDQENYTGCLINCSSFYLKSIGLEFLLNVRKTQK